MILGLPGQGSAGLYPAVLQIMLFLNQDIELCLDLRRQHQYLDSTHYDDPFFNFSTLYSMMDLNIDVVEESSSLMQVVSACGNMQSQPFEPFNEDLCRMALHLQPGPIPGVYTSVLP